MTKDKALRGVVFNIQRYSIHDGPGIRTTVFLKGCPLRCFWCQNPESQKSQPELFLDRSKCVLCGLCVGACPNGANTILDEQVIIDRSKCTGCGKCVEVCPAGARRVMGRYMTVDEVMVELLKDVKFYENSGGGITLSGGDAVAQPEFALAILKKCKEDGLHTTLETCGYAPWSTLEKLIEYTDFVLFDIKCIDARKHRTGTGRLNRIILENAKRLAGYRPMKVRVPMIPDFNDLPEEVEAIARFVRAELDSIDIDLLPYNKLGEGKYKFLDKMCVPLKARDEEYMQTLRSIINPEANNNPGPED